MIRFTWRQLRTQAVVALGALVAVAVIVVATGPHVVHLFQTTVAPCTSRGDCPAATTAFARLDRTLRMWLGVVVIVAPAVLGVFWGAPLVAREIEDQTYQLAWTQGVTRTRWVTVKIALIGLVAMAVAGLLSLAVTWWASPLDQVRMSRYATFDQRDVVPIGYAAFAVALGVTIGILMRRTLPAMATTMACFVAARVAFVESIRPHLFAPVHQSLTLNPTSTGYGSTGSLLSGVGPSTLQPDTPSIPNAWITSTKVVDRTGHSLTTQVLKAICPNLGSGGPGPGGGASRQEVPTGAQQALQDCVTRVGATYHELVTYHPANRYWAFQWYELAIFLGAAAVLAGISIWWLRSRFS